MICIAVAGGGPVGLMLASELRLAGASVIVLERLLKATGLSKATGISGQLVEALDHRGLLAQFSVGLPYAGPATFLNFAGLRVELDKLGTNPLSVLPLRQARLEELLEQRALELGVEIRRGHEITAVSQDKAGVAVKVRGPYGEYGLRVGYLVGCDGAHSVVRRQAGIGFPGTGATVLIRRGDVRLPDSLIQEGDLALPGLGRLPFGTKRTVRGLFAFAPLGSGMYRVSCTEWGQQLAHLRDPISIGELSASVSRVLGTDLPMTDPGWLSRSTDASRQAERYRAGRILLAGDAAHVHVTFGGPGLNLGLQDAINLGWKLAAQLRGRAPAGLLDSYHAERHPAARRVLMHTQAQLALMAPGEHIDELRALFSELLKHEHNVSYIAEMLAGADNRYDMPAGDAIPHPCAGRWAPDLRFATADGRSRIPELMHTARPVLLDLTVDGHLHGTAAPWRGRVDLVTARCVQRDPPAEALLIRPDGYIAWALAPGERGRNVQHQLRHAMTSWFGAAG